MALTKEQVNELKDMTVDAYSYSRYKPMAWKNAINLLDAEGFSRTDIKWILFHKLMRWAADSFAQDVNGEERCDGSEIIQYHKTHTIKIEMSTEEINEDNRLFEQLDFHRNISKELKEKPGLKLKKI